MGIVVHSYANGDAYEIEFLSLDGNTIGTCMVSAIDLKPISRQAIMHERLRLTA